MEMKKLLFLTVLLATQILLGCRREPELHLYEGGDMDLDLPMIELDLEAYWDYKMVFGVEYDWKAEWYYGWDSEDHSIFGEIGYVEPTVFNLRRYFTNDVPYAPHHTVSSDVIYTNYFHGKYAWGFWDILVWSDATTDDGVQSLNFDESSSLDSVSAYTNPTMHSIRYQAPKYTRSFYQPEQLFAAYEQGIEINQNLDGFVYDEERRVWVKRLDMMLKPITYIYLTQVILHHNNNRVTGTDGTCNLSAMARYTNVNLGRGGDDVITVAYNSRFKPGCDKMGENVDIFGGRLLTFGISNLRANEVTRPEEIKDTHRHYMDINMQFNNGMDSTFVFDVTDQVRRRFKGGVITVELDMDTVPIPTRKGGSGFDAVVKDYEDGGTHEFDM